MWFKARRRWLVVLPALIVSLVYLPALGGGFVWDDLTFLRDLPLYRDPASRLQALFQPFVISPNYFRPLALLTFVVELGLADLNPSIFHLTNILVHALNTALVTLLARRFVAGEAEGEETTLTMSLLPLGVGLLYGLHPALVEGVAFISSRFDLLLTTFLLLALLADVYLHHRVLRPLAVALAFLLAALSKEMAVAFVLLLPLWHLARAQHPLLPLSRLWQSARQVGDLAVYAGVLAAGGVYLVVRSVSLGYLLLPGGAGIASGDPLQHLLLVGKSLAEYGKLIVWPFTALTPIHYTVLPIPTGDVAVWVSLAGVLALVAGLTVLVRTAPRAGWLALAGFLSLLPVVNLLPLDLTGGAFIAERFLLFPLVLFSLAAVSSLQLLAAWKSGLGRTLRWALPLLWLAASVVIIQNTLPHWKDNLAFWTWGEQCAPLSPVPYVNLAREYSDRGDHEAGLEAAQRGLELAQDDGMAWNNAGLNLFHLGRYDEAQAAFERALELEPDNALFWNNLAGTLMEQDQLQEAEQVLLEALRRDPNQPLAHLNLGALYLQIDRPDLAIPSLQEALRLLPPAQIAKAEALFARTQEPARWLRLGDALLARGDPEGALLAFEQAGVLGAWPGDVGTGRSAALIEMEAWSEAEAMLREALPQAPNDARLYNNLGVVARAQGDLETARQYFSQAVTLAPEWDLPRQNLADLESQP